MATTVQLISLQEVLFGAFRFSGQTNQMAEAMTTAQLDATALGDGTVVYEPGRKGYGFAGEGFWSSTIDADLIAKQRTRNVPVTVALTTGIAGTFCRSVKSMISSYEIGAGEQGELLPVSYEFGAMGGPVRGTILHNTESTGNVTGTAFNVGAPTSQSVYGVLHVFSGTGTFDVLIQSASDEAFTSPNTRFTFTQIATGTAQAYEWATPITTGDAWWRVSATNPSTRDFAVVVAIQ